MNDSTKCVQAGETRHHQKAAITTEIAEASVFVMPTLDELRRYAEGRSDAYMYTRYANPTTRVAEQKLATLEEAEDCLVTASGMSAILCAALSLLKAGDEIVSMLDIYGGTLKLFDNVLSRCSINTRFVPFEELGKIESCFTTRTRMLFLESPTNPTLRCAELDRLTQIGHRHNCVVMVDSTFATPILQKPLRLGADLVIHSATKYLGGHNDVTAGAVCGPKQLIDPMRETMKYCGTTLDPLASYLLIRGLKTLEIRVQRACQNARAVAEFLSKHPKVERVFYPGFANHQGHEAASRQMRDFGMMVSFDVKGGGPAAERLIDSLNVWYLATSLGGVESCVSYPLWSSHVGLSEERLRLLQVSPATIRLSCGIEDAADLIADLEQGLEH